MTALDVLQQLHDLGVLLTPLPDGSVRYCTRKGGLTPAMVDAMRQHKQELHALGEAFEERAAIAEYGGELSRAEAEALAWACILAEPVHGDSAACGYPAVTGAT
jgi:hypothetical protein